MDVFVRDLPDQMTEKQVYKYFRQPLERLGIKTYRCEKLRKKGCAIVTFLDDTQARRFLSAHGYLADPTQGSKFNRQALFHQNRRINCTPSKNRPDPYIIRSLQKQEHTRSCSGLLADPVQSHSQVEKGPIRRKFSLRRAWCGQWDYLNDDLIFAEYYQSDRPGNIVFSSRGLFITLFARFADGRNPVEYMIEIPYRSVESYTTGSTGDPSLTFSLWETPRIFEKLQSDTFESTGDVLRDMLQGMLISEKKPSPIRRKRISSLDDRHKIVVGSCLCYRFQLLNPEDIKSVQGMRNIPEIPFAISWATPRIQQKPFAAQWRSLITTLSSYHDLSHELKFQFQRLAQNGSLPPYRVNDLLERIRPMVATTNEKALVDAVFHLSSYIPFPGPDVAASDLNVNRLVEEVKRSAERINIGSSYLEDVEGYGHLVAVHKATVTPTSILLEGPFPEVKNRVLRKYADHGGHFLSVTFQDEDSEPLRHDMQTSNADIYGVRFKHILDTSISIAGMSFQFLGFSHSSLRSHTCWFMAPFVHDGTLIYAREVIKRLGDFSHIRSPAKCAARIGQAFSQTLSSVDIPEEAFQKIDDVQRNGRVFSDGCGTCSLDVLNKIWDTSFTSGGMKPTVLQVRIQGAKGVLSVDERLEGMVLNLRDSMIKFKTENIFNVEICGSARRPLPMYLNRQLIKILEDLGVNEESFMALQSAAVAKLRATTKSVQKAARFLKRNDIGKNARLPWLIRKLSTLDLRFDDDDFLKNTLELAVVAQLRELKHRARILVEKGVTLYGIMDETDFLEEGQIYCSLESSLVTGTVVITRCPALHPGDIQLVEAVHAPISSPLRRLHNVVVFSSKGQRDLPSMLSGGDLDGDLYNIIYDPTLIPNMICSPADYNAPHPIDIGRAVETHDMTNHFLDFMENDCLGRIATLHQIIADRQSNGTYDDVCLRLAELHSEAVDFSKTGIPVRNTDIPRYPKARPDFLAKGPRVLIEKTLKLEDEEAESVGSEPDELDEAASYEPPRMLYYESQKILGKLYRDIDERKFFETLQAQARHVNSASQGVIEAVWAYVTKVCSLIQWYHLVDVAEDIRESYEDNLADTMIAYSTDPHHPVSEVEVFSGSILGKLGAQSKRQREYSIDMKKRYDRDVAYTTHTIRYGDTVNDQTEALERSIACLFVAVQRPRQTRKKIGALVSFRWVAAAVCLREVDDMLAGKMHY